MSPKYRLALSVGGPALALDQITKAGVDHWMRLHQSIEIFPNFAHLTYIRNPGAAFGFLSGSPASWRMGFFIIISLVAIGCILYLLKNLRPSQNTLGVSLALILSGAVGNFIDRVRMGEVIDFIDLHWYEIHWPAFNLADSAITVGVVLLFIQLLRKRSFEI
ncbi:MAG: signal peptidase II [Deltaproteobacteria bacterium]|nr:signal peptidase II [Deltaproteobacteria bacterium]